MYSLACRTLRIISWEYCGLSDHGTLKGGLWEAWALRGPLRLRLPLRQKWVRNPARGEPLWR